MMKWDKNKLYSMLAKYNALYKKETDYENLLELEEVIGSIEAILEYDKKPSILDYKATDYVDIVDSDLEILDTYGYYCPIIKTTQPVFNSYGFKIPDLKKMNTSDVFKATNAFYNSFEDTITMSYNYIKKTFPTNFQLYRLRKSEECAGITYSIYNSDESYYSVGINNTQQDYISMIHEVEHGINNSLNINIILDYEKYCFLEADSLFMELIGNDFIGNRYSELEAFKIKLSSLKDYLYSASLICNKMDMYNEFNGGSLYSSKKAKSYLYNLGYDKVYIKDVTNTYIQEIFHYIISYLTAIELYMIYQSDKNLAILLLIKIRDCKNLSNEEYLEFVRSIGIEPGKNLNHYVEELLELDKSNKLIWKKNTK